MNVIFTIRPIYLLLGLFLVEISEALFGNARPMTKGNGPIYCSAIVSQCVNRCDERSAISNIGVEYVQFRTDIMQQDGAMACVVKETTPDEIISTNPPRPSPQMIVFNVPCCQQKLPQEKEENVDFVTMPSPQSEITTAVSTAGSDSQIDKNCNPMISVESLLQNYPLLQKAVYEVLTDKMFSGWSSKGTPLLFNKRTEKPDTDKNEWQPLRDDLTLAVTIATCFLLLILLILIIFIIARRRNRKSKSIVVQTNPVQNSPITCSTSNGGHTIVPLNDLNSPTKDAKKVLAKVVNEIEPPVYAFNNPVLEKTNSDSRENVAKFVPSENNLDYVVLETVQRTPPKSARSSRNRSKSSRSEEVMIIGTSRQKQLQPESHHILQNSDAKSFDLSIADERTHIGTIDIALGGTIQPQLPGRNSHKEAMRETFLQRRADSLPEKSHLVEVEYDNVAPDIISQALPPVPQNDARYIDNNSIKGQCSKLHSTNAGSEDYSQTSPQFSIYNVLGRENKTDPSGDYQRLKRSDTLKTTSSDDDINMMTKEKQLPSFQPIEVDYVQDFQILKKSSMTKGKQEGMEEFKDGGSDKENECQILKDMSRKSSLSKQAIDMNDNTASLMGNKILGDHEFIKATFENENSEMIEINGMTLPETEDL